MKWRLAKSAVVVVAFFFATMWVTSLWLTVNVKFGRGLELDATGGLGSIVLKFRDDGQALEFYPIRLWTSSHNATHYGLTDWQWTFGACGILFIFPLWAPTLLFAMTAFGLWLFGRRRRRSDAKRCTKCGYDLRGTIEPRCPECGTAFDPQARPAGNADA